VKISRAGSLLLLLVLGGCGAVVGAAVDRANDFVMHPFRDWIFGDSYRYANDWESRFTRLPNTHDGGGVTLGVAISGGGSRSAYFAACVLDELGRTKIPGSDRTYLDEVDFISAVSGGSLAAAYYCANRHAEGYPAEHGAFFARMREDMSMNFELRIVGRFFLGDFLLLEFTNFDRADMFGDLWDAHLLHDTRFGDLDPAGPALFINATSYDTGEKFVFTRDPLPPFSKRVAEIVGTEAEHTWVGERRVVGRSLTFETLDSDVAPCPLSTAVKASSAVPTVLGPIVLRDRAGSRDIHLGDGGVYDNHGFETLLEGMQGEARAHPERPLIILVIDGAGFFQVGGAKGELRSAGDYFDRCTAIAWVRLAVYEEIALHFAKEAARRRGVDYPLGRLLSETISLYDDRGLAREGKDAVKSAETLKRLRAVGTRFSLSEEATQAIADAAPRVTRLAIERLETSLREQSLPPRTR
jgi:predicted acylesterase/phospholipase RssA